MEPNVLTSSARCIEKAQIICIKASELQRIIKERPSIEGIVMRNLARIISYRLRDTRNQVVSLVVELIKQGK